MRTIEQRSRAGRATRAARHIFSLVSLTSATVLMAALARADVDSAGAFEHSLEIALPPAVGGVQPEIALTYHSHRGNGLVGIGWDLEGIPVITRMNHGRGINYDAGDTFVGPGGRLVNFSGSHVYHTEDETWTRYVPYKGDGSVWSGTGGCNNGPCYWRATTANGGILEFGSTDNSRIEAVGRGGSVREWALAKVTDTAGNFYTVTYFEDSSGGDYRPVSVTYNQGNGRSKLYTVEFAYEPRDDHGAEFFQSARVDLDRRLQWVTVKSGGQLIRKYHLSYDYGATTGASRLIAFREYGRDGSALPAQTFRWQEGSRNWATFTSLSGWGPNSGFGDVGRYPLYVGDWNGDGRTDFGRVHNSGTTFQISTGSGWQHYADDWDGGPNRGFTDSNRYPTLSGDWNGDGKTDYGRVNDAGIYFRVSSGTGWHGYPDRRSWGPNDGFIDGTAYPLLIGDWNGDGKTDIGRVHNWGIHFDVSTGSGWAIHAAGPDWSPNTGFTNASRYPVLTGDWNGDGKTDIGRVHNGGVAFATSTGSGWQHIAGISGWGPDSGYVDGNVYPILTGDWNGDHRTDVGRVHHWGIHFYVSTGAGWEPYAAGPNWSPSQGFSSANDYPVFIGDWDGDGRTDIGRVHNTGVVFQTSTGSGWQAFGEWTHWGRNEGYVNGSVYPTLAGDWTGEGKSGLGRVDNAGITFITRLGATPDLMTSLTNVLGGTTEVTYRPATWVANAVRPDVSSCTGPAGPLVGTLCGNANANPLPLVTRVAVSTAGVDARALVFDADTYSTRYEYYNARYFPGVPSVAENLGFSSVKEIDEQLGRSQTTTFRQDKPFHGRTSSAESRTSGAQLVSRASFGYADIQSPHGTRLLRLVNEDHEQYELGVFKYRTRTTYAHDEFGNVTLAANLNDTASAADDVYESASYVNDTTQWRIGFVHTRATCADASCAAVLQTSSSSYDDLPGGQIGARAELTQQATWRSDTSAWPTTTYVYDASGNLSTRINAAGVRDVSNEYDQASGALLRATDAVGNAVSHEYDAVTGQLVAVRDPNGNASRFYYDAFGRKRRTETPHDGTVQTIVEESWSYAPNLHVVTVHTDRGPLVTTRRIDGLGRVRKVTQTWDNGALLQTDAFFDFAGREHKTCAPHLASQPHDESSCTTRHFDAAGRVARVDSPRSGGGFVSTTTSYDGYRTTETDSLGNVTVSDYDPATLTSTFHQPGGLVTATQKDLLGRVARVIDPAGNSATYRYNSLGWTLDQVDPVTGASTYEYDVLGRLSAHTDAAGRTIRMDYDAAGRLLRRDYAPHDVSAAGPEDALFKYDYVWSPGDIVNGRGKLVSVRDRSSGTLFAYDAAGRVRGSITDIEGTQYWASTTFDRTGRRTSVTYPDGSIVAYHYATDAQHLSSITLDGVEIMSYADYNEHGAPTTFAYGDRVNQVSLTFEASTGELLQQQDSRGFVDNFYTYDARGLLVEERDLRAEKPNGDSSKAFAYDPLRQLVGAAMGSGALCNVTACSGEAWSRRYVYDAVGRVLEKDGKAFTYDVSRHFQLTRIAGETADRTYDPVGRLLSRTAASGEVDTYINGSDGFLQEHRRGGQTLHRMTYDYRGNRVKKEFLGTNAQTTWDVGNYKVVFDRNTGKYFHTLYVTGLHGSRIAHRTVEKPGLVAAAAFDPGKDRLLASMYEPMSVGGFLPWAEHGSKAVFQALMRDIDGARGVGAAFAGLAMLLCVSLLAIVCLGRLARWTAQWATRGSLPAIPLRRRRGWLAPAALVAATAACVGQYGEPEGTAADAQSIAKDGRYRVSQALTRGGTNEPVPGVFYYLNTPLGSTSVMFDAQGAALLRLEYFPDGTVNKAASVGDYIATHTYGQKESDKELELYYNAFRYYDAETMRFTTPDAIKDSDDFLVHNIYAYTRNNPVNYIDPTGFIWAMKPDGVRGAVAAGRSPVTPPRVTRLGSQQIDGPRGPVAAPRAKAPPRSIPAKRPPNPVRTDRFNRGPDGGPRVPIKREVVVPWRDYLPPDGSRGYQTHGGSGGMDPVMFERLLEVHILNLPSAKTPQVVHDVLGAGSAFKPVALIDAGLYLIVDGDLPAAGMAALGARGAARGGLKNASGNLDDAAAKARTQPHRPDTVSVHARGRMETRGVSYESIQEAVRQGTRTFDPATGVARYDLPASASSTGRAVTVIRNDVTGNIITVIDRGSR